MTDERNVAVVLGASATGAMAAAALARAYARVIVIERDALPTEPAPRKGVGQGRHNHNVTPRATQALARLFPGVLDELRARGASVCDIGADGVWYLLGHRMPRVEVGQPQVLASRPVLDAALLARLAAAPNVELRDRTDVCGLLGDPARVRGVRVISRREGLEETLGADLVVDASGRGSRTPRWLEELGLAAPDEERVDVDVSYTTRCFRRRPTDLGGDRFVYAAAVPPDRARGAVAFAVEDERWMILQFGYGERTPTDLEGFRRFAASLDAPELLSIIDGGEPILEPATYAYPRSTRRRYDLARMPAGLIVVGDALQSTNPSWGLGITSAALQVELLEARLARRGDPSAGFHRAAIQAGAAVWVPVVTRDRSFHAVAGEPAAGERWIGRLVGAVFRAARTRPALAKVVLEVVGYTRTPLALLRPDRLAIALAAGRGESVAPSPTPAAVS